MTVLIGGVPGRADKVASAVVSNSSRDRYTIPRDVIGTL
jgi:hypothetical protein